MNFPKNSSSFIIPSNKTGEEYKAYQDPNFCSYIISQTFKKTFNDMTEFLATSGSLIEINVKFKFIFLT